MAADAKRIRELKAELEELKALEARLGATEAAAAPTPGAAPEPKKEKKEKKAKKGKPAKTVTAPALPTRTPLEAAKSEEEFGRRKLEGLMSGYVETLLPAYKEIARKGETKTFCMPPSVKESLTKKLRTDIKNKIDAIERDKELKKPVSEQEAALVTKLYALAEAVKRTPACEIKELDEMFDIVMKEYPEKADMTFEEMIDQIRAEKTAAKVSRSSKARRALSEKITEEVEAILESKGLDMSTATPAELDVAKAEAAQKVAKSMPDRSQDEFLRSWHGALSKKLQGYLYDGAKGQEGDQMYSPCGLKMDMDGLAAIAKAEDLLTFFGSKDDWKDFYIDANEAVEGETFHRMSAKDWPGCMKDLFFGNLTLTNAEIKEVIKRVNKKRKKKGLDLLPEDFASVENFKKGYGY